MPKKSIINKMCRVPIPSGANNNSRKSKESVQFKGNWEETRDSLHKKINQKTIFEESSSDDDDENYGPRKSMAPKRMTVAAGLDVVTSNLSFQEKMQEREEKEKRNKSVLGNVLRKTKVWVQEAVTGEPVFSDEDWEENLARETALEKIKKKKDKEFRRSIVRKSVALGLDKSETDDMIRNIENRPLRLTAEEIAMVEAETQRLVEISREEREEEEEERRISKAIEKKNKLPNRFSLALKTVVFGADKVSEDLSKHPRFASKTSVHESGQFEGETRETQQRRPTKFHFGKVEVSDDEEEEEDSYETETEEEEELEKESQVFDEIIQNQSESESEETLIYEQKFKQDEFKIEHEIQKNNTVLPKLDIKPAPPKEPSPRDHTPRPQDKFKNNNKSPVITHTKIKKNKKNRRKNRKNVSVEDLSLQVDLSQLRINVKNEDDDDLYSIVEVNEIGCQFPSLCGMNGNDSDDCASLKTDCSESIALPSYRPVLKNQSQESFSPKKNPLKVELIPWAEEVWNKYIESNDLASPQKFLDKQSNRHDISLAIHQNVKLFQEPSNINVNTNNNNQISTIPTESAAQILNPPFQPENHPLPETPIFKRENRHDSIITLDLINAPVVNNEDLLSKIDDEPSLTLDSFTENNTTTNFNNDTNKQTTKDNEEVNDNSLYIEDSLEVKTQGDQVFDFIDSRTPSQIQKQHQVEPHKPSDMSLFR